MEPVNDKRSGDGRRRTERRKDADPNYAGPERRSGDDRRDGGDRRTATRG